VSDVGGILSYPFMVHAFEAGTTVAVVCGAMGWFMVLRRQTFAGHTLAVVGFPGAAGAVLLGVSAGLGYFAFCVAAALIIGAAAGTAEAPSYRDEPALIGTVQAMALGLGFLFVSLYHGNLTGLTGLLFGSFLGITERQVVVLLLVGASALLALAAIGRPVLFASVDPDVAEAAGLPVRALAIGFLVLLGVAVAEASQITGSLLVFALLVLPPATAQVITGRPVLGMGLAVAIGVAVTWTGLVVAFYTPYPPGFYLTTLGFAAYVVARAVRGIRTRRSRSSATETAGVARAAAS
jgi:zinc/manganese transport system permease protein